VKRLITIMCPSLDGGWGRVLINLANFLKQMDIDIHIMLDDISGSFTSHLVPGIEVYPLKTSHRIGGIPYFSYYARKHRPDVILTTIVRHTALALTVMRLTNIQTRIYPSIHNAYGIKFKELSVSKYRSRLRIIRKSYPQCDGIIAVSEGVKEDFCSLTGIPAGSVTTIYNPIYDDKLIEQSLDPVDHPWFQEGQPPVILGAGRLEKQKNFSLLIESFDLLRSRKECRLAIIGDGRERDFLESRVRDSDYSADISLMGYQANPFPLMKRASVFVLSSSWEGFGNVLIEAMATGTPVVSTDCPHGPREILMDGRYGPLVAMNAPADLAEAITKTLENPLSEEILRERASTFSIQSSAENYLKLFGLIRGN